MAQVSTSDVVQLFKRVYGDLSDLQPQDFPLAKDIPFSQKQKVGDSYYEALVLSNEAGWTLGGSSMDAFNIEPAVAGAVKQASVSPYITVLASVIPWGVITRSAGAGEKAFYEATKHVTRNNLKSHGKLVEILRWHGQSAQLLGYVSYATATYRGVSFTNGGGALTINGTSVTFTAGVNTTSKWILLAPGNFAAGIWVGSEGAVVQEVDSSGVVIKEGTLDEVDSEMGAIRCSFTPTAASSTTSHRLCFKGMGEAKEMVGVKKILETASGNLFGVSTTNYSLWRGHKKALGATKFTLAHFLNGIAECINRGGLDGDLELYLNPRSFSTLISTEAALRSYDSSYGKASFDTGAERVTFYHPAGKATIKACRFVMEGDIAGLHLPDWSRSGSSEITFTLPSMGDQQLIYPLENQAAMAFRSYSDQYVFCNAPARSILWTGCNDESAT